MGIDPASLGLNGCSVPGTHAILPEETEGFFCHVFDHIGGTEPCGWAGMCEAKDGMHVIEPFFLVEILDRETLQREVDEGEMGVAVVTPLGRRSFPLIRFNTKDLVIKGKDHCVCERTSKKIREVVGRTDDLRKIRGSSSLRKR
jgi:phenylacetate-CoA ligase